MDPVRNDAPASEVVAQQSDVQVTERREKRRDQTADIVRIILFVLMGFLVLLFVLGLVAIVMGAWVAVRTTSVLTDGGAGELVIKLNPSLWVGKTLQQAQAWASSTGRPLRIVRANDFSYPATTDYVAARVNVDVRINVNTLMAMSAAETLAFTQSHPELCTISRVTTG